jgi:hypothetical protein
VIENENPRACSGIFVFVVGEEVDSIRRWQVYFWGGLVLVVHFVETEKL